MRSQQQELKTHLLINAELKDLPSTLPHRTDRLFNPGFITACRERFAAISETKHLSSSLITDLLDPILERMKTLWINESRQIMYEADFQSVESLFHLLDKTKTSYKDEYSASLGYVTGHKTRQAIEELDKNIRQVISFSTGSIKTTSDKLDARSSRTHDPLFNVGFLATVQETFQSHYSHAKRFARRFNEELLNPIVTYMSHIYIDQQCKLQYDGDHTLMGLFLLISQQKQLLKNEFHSALSFRAGRDLREALDELEQTISQFARYSLGNQADVVINSAIKQAKDQRKALQKQQVLDGLQCIVCCLWCPEQYALTAFNCLGIGNQCCSYYSIRRGESCTFFDKECGSKPRSEGDAACSNCCEGCNTFNCSCCAPLATMRDLVQNMGSRMDEINRLDEGPARLSMI